MKYLIVADIHYSLKQFDWVNSVAQKFDLVVLAGDLLDLVSIVERDAQAVVALNYLRRIREKTRLLASSGNHDAKDKSAEGEWAATWLQDSRNDDVLVDRDSAVIDETFFTICPWWDGDLGRDAVLAQLVADAAKPKAHWAWIYHCPPHGTPLSWNGKKHFGDPHLGEWIKRFQPDLVFAGHVHEAPFRNEGSWVHRIGKTFIFNAGRQHGPIPAFLVWNTDDADVTWISQAGTERVSLSAFAGIEVLA
ncbi:MAG: Icc-related predicted phosphoesterase [Limisphaerales bacterium]|jgi:Icc-related predicted phosphoesterase